MLFTLELEGIGVCYRLQKDESWRNTAENQELMTNDFTTKRAYEITSRSYCKKTIKLEGITYDIDPRMWPTNHEQLNFSSRVFRRLYPSEPTFEQLRETITLGNDSVSNVLILNVNGNFELRQKPPFNHLTNDPTIVIRHETYVAGNGYVGIDAGKDKKFIEDVLTMSIDYWVVHLKNHITQNYSDLHSTKSLEEIRNDLRQNWKPDY
ncbi:MAG: hypothetical protein KUA37_07495 [Desulfomicrobium sp.]|nr:hypothetical protein [Pseudomonadota bacterium]MBV1711834.1 hypothetical protein [Desulfomicrobium sp.]MBU4572578.1 hypothetical protein [Pseudomonadota bacterium]MBU4593640.1 hypothetical protein [Pseudomonadota bacterium]MBV1719104.1 hypothetical protein [Desulfomicrobium sp.]